ncbi:MAG: hypothetical protein DWQ11_15555 [Proteobacteria bacterium]|nr:MAG: hypothetical protein DWQ11_15555 [Pseudomonadota bacterium]
MSRRMHAPVAARPWISRADRLGRIAYGPSSETARTQQRLTQFVHHILAQQNLGRPGMAAAALVMFEAVVTEMDLTAALAAIEDAYVWRERVHIDWVWRDGWQDRRRLSGATCRIIAAGGRIRAVEELRHLAALARCAVTYWSDLSDRDAISSLLNAAGAWAMTQLPGALFAHVNRDAPYQALPRSVLIREATGIPDHCNLNRGEDADDLILADAVYQKGTAWDSPFIDELVRTVRTALGRSRSHAHARANLLSELAMLATRASRGGWVCALLHLWVRDLVTSGTTRTPQLAPATIINYTAPVLRPLAERLADEPEPPGDTALLEAIYDEIRAGVSAGNQVNVASGLTAFHAFLVRRFDMAPLTRRLHDAIEDAPPRANTVWPHEMDLVHAWLETGDGDARLRASLSVAFRLAWAARFRISELLTLRLRNVVADDGGVEVAPLRRDGKTKTRSSLRVVTLDDPARHALSGWIERRRAEGAQDMDLVFGSPHDGDGVYRAGAMRLSLSQLLKYATGDTDVVFHTLSHRRAAVLVAERLPHAGDIDINPLDEIAAEFGHHSPQTLTHYLHEFEGWLRAELDSAIQRTWPLTSTVAALLSGEPAARLRQRSHRSGHGVQQVYWTSINRLPQAGPWGTLSAEGEKIVPSPPRWLSAPMRLTPAHVANVLDDLLAGRQPDQVASRSGLQVEAIFAIAEAAMRFLHVIGAARQMSRMPPTGDNALVELRAWSRSKGAFDLVRRHQAKFSDIARRLPTRTTTITWRAWAESYSRGYIALTERFADALLVWLSDCGVSPLCLALSAENAIEDAHRIALLNAKFLTVFGVRPRCFEHIPRQGRPPIYLLWSSEPIGDSPPAPASTSLAGLHAWMLATGIASECTAETLIPKN